MPPNRLPVFLQPQDQPGKIFGRPIAYLAAKAAHLAQEGRIVADRQDLWPGADHAFVGKQGVKPIVIHHRQGANGKAAKRLLDARPFRLDHLPTDARPENPLRHGGQPAVIGDRGQLIGGFCNGNARENRRFAAFALGCDCQNFCK